ncbi:hypothetical protein FN846DRAFT_963736 [Sphaerosporella brunnea]|uniref:Uncharacterized protein n=1 Tax=Sphaerosporella brunnea TaxID=1250544 RepID=A0A5J5EN72_9PEZI|nr:hypothetical protein FN846DRAFT_963736 [Sphaerosporella brunnea]
MTTSTVLSSAMPNSTDISKSLENLHISPKTTPKKPTMRKKAEPVDSWENESLSSSESEAETEAQEPLGTNSPPPTSAASIRGHHDGFSATLDSTTSRAPFGVEHDARPTTTDAVARRMISAALGVRTKSTKEQREFDAAVREKEKKRREEERARRREEEKKVEEAKRSVWED